ncbi:MULTISPECIES: hypothetical protein [Tenacibaculum]|uniref:hypothetical protein n=1 Tax=Tenacibaculum TaxID=104267 RepID=UPI001F0B2409|nr:MULTISPECIES: hypothetical protein [Tenacibaculum]MCH3883290.1 hypothetical protein [Tenacibaculum aquimarinum]MDO6600354.1 hypothetical protein [Tenacibaculum sp. 1_MG-2023]
MNKIAKYISRTILVSFLFFILILSCDVPLYNASGTYINKNYESKYCCFETPHIADTLILYKDGTFNSDYYGKGKYDINNQIGNISIYLNADRIGVHTTMSNKLFQRIEISLSSNTNHHYLKID